MLNDFVFEPGGYNWLTDSEQLRVSKWLPLTSALPFPREWRGKSSGKALYELKYLSPKLFSRYKASYGMPIPHSDSVAILINRRTGTPR